MKYNRDQYIKSHGASRVYNMLRRRYGQRYIDYRSDWKKSEEYELLPFPLNILIDLVNSCNLRCYQCARSEDLQGDYEKYLSQKSMLSMDNVRLILSEAQKYNLPSVTIGTTGESLLYPDISDVCTEIMKHDILEFRIISNGILLNKELSEMLIDLQVHVLSISLDAISKETYGLLRGKESIYQMVVDNIKTFLMLRRKRNSQFPLLRVTFVKQYENKHETAKFVNFWSQHADIVDIQTYHDLRSKTYSNNFDCTDPWRRLSILSNGDVYPCCGFQGIEYIVGSIMTDKLISIWNGNKIKKIRKMLFGKNYLLPCLKCKGTKIEYPD